MHADDNVVRMNKHFFFFSSRRRHTRFDCDWSSDVCSSDLAVPRFSTTMFPTPLKSLVSSATPKLTLGVPSAACAVTDVCVAPKGCTSPLPPRRAELLASWVASAVLTMAAATSAASHAGCACMASAALPATCGAAIEVPDMNTPWLPVPMPVEKTLMPGAEDRKSTRLN